MRFPTKVIGNKKKNSVESNPELRRLIQEASRVADQAIDRSYYAGGSWKLDLKFEVTKDSEHSFPLINLIDKILQLVPDEPDMLFAKAEAHSLLLDDETGQRLRREVLRLDANHFNAYMREKHFKEWGNIFTYPGWGGELTKVPPFMLAIQEDGGYVQIVREGLAPTLAVMYPVNRDNFPPEIIDARWKPFWVETPFGPIFPHYAMFSLPNDKIYRQEFSISPYPLQKIHELHGNWLIRRFCEVNSIFLVVNDGEDIIYNSQFAYSQSVRSTLESVKEKLQKMTLPQDYEKRYQRGMEWYTQNSDIELIPY